MLWALIGLLLGGFLAWYNSAPPLVGGGQPDGIRARWVKSRVYQDVAPVDEQGFARLTPQNAGGWYGVFREPIQTLENYKSQNPMRPTTQRGVLVIQPIGAMNAEQTAMLQSLKEFCEAFFQLPVRVEAPLGLQSLKQERNERGQLDAGKIIDDILAPRLPADAAAYLGVTMTDLTAGDMNYVFGVGSFERRTGIYSLCRYFPEFWGRKSTGDDEVRALRRACQVLAHESGHVFGLQHCVLYKCAMNGSNSLGDADGAPLDFCPVCHRKLLWNGGSDGAKRYAGLLAFYRKHGLAEEARWTKARLARWKQIAA